MKIIDSEGRQALIIPVLFAVLLMLSSCSRSPQTVRFGVVADCQYCDCTAAGTRHYRQSPGKLEAAIDTFNRHDLDFIVHLGDFIDRDAESFAVLNPIASRSKVPVYHVLGNHDYAVEDSIKSGIPDSLGMPSRYYAFEEGRWKFLVLDGNDLSFQGYPSGSVPDDAKKMLAELRSEEKANAQQWNGGIGKTQRSWVQQHLQKAEQQDQNVILFCHFPIYPSGAHNIWNDAAVRDLISGFDCVKAWMNGHNHAGLYGEQDSLHFVTFPGMVETPETNAFGIVTLEQEEIAIEGFGRVRDQVLVVR